MPAQLYNGVLIGTVTKGEYIKKNGMPKNAVVMNDADIAKIVQRMKNMSENMLPQKVKRAIMVKASRPMIEAIRASISDSGRTRKVHHKQRMAKLAKTKNFSKTGKYKKQKEKTAEGYATYKSGNLKKSIQVLPIQRKSANTYVGAKVVRKPSGEYGGGTRKTNAYYGHFVQYGVNTKHGYYRHPSFDFMNRGFKASHNMVKNILITELQKRFNTFAIK